VKLKTLAIVTAVLLAAAVLGTLARHMGGGKGQAQGRAGQNVLKPEDVEHAATIRFATGAVTSTLKATPEMWVVQEQYDFAVDRENLSNFFFKLAELKFDRFISKDPQSYAGVGALLPSENGGKTEPDKTGIEFSVLDDKGQARLHYVFGSRRKGDTAEEGPAGGMYVRDLSDGSVYLISGSPRILTKPEEWIHIVILNFDEKKDIKALSVRRPGKPETVLHRVGEPPEKVDFETKVDWTMDGAPAGKKVSARAVGEMAKGVGDLFMVRVADPKLTPEQMGRTEIATLGVDTFDGRHYTLTSGLKDDKEGFRYLTAEASLDPKSTDDKAKKIVEDYNRMFKGRMFAINGWSADRMLVERDHLFEEEPAAVKAARDGGKKKKN
jgi:hypothetical protein